MNISELAVSRQKVLIGAGLGLVAAVLAACSSAGKKPEASGEPSPTGASTASSAAGAGPTAASGANAIAKTSDVPVGSGLIAGDVVVTQPTAGVFKAFSAKCTHLGCMVNKIADGTIDCPCHGSKFNLDGTVATGPAQQPLQAQNVTVQGDSIVLS